MSQAPAMPVFTDALIGDTTHLSTEQFGAYCLLLFATWRNNGQPLPNDDVRLARICRTGLHRFRTEIKPRLIEFFDISSGYLRQKRLEKEWVFVSTRREQQSAKGKRSAALRALKTNDTVPTTVAPGLQPDGNTHTHTHKEETPPIGGAKKTASRGTRWPASEGIYPDGRMVPDDWSVEAATMRPEVDVIGQAEAFADFWIAKSGANATKLDWRATWRTWIRNSKPASRPPREVDQPFVARFRTADEIWSGRLNILRNGGAWEGDWGAPPSDPECQAPRELLIQFGHRPRERVA